MMIVRPIESADIAALERLVMAGGVGLTNLPRDPGVLRERISESARAFAAEVSAPGEQRYLFVLEDTEAGAVAGTCGIVAAVGLSEAFYSYRVGVVVHASRELGVYNQMPTLYLSNDHTGCTELIGLLLAPHYRRGDNGRLLSKARLLFLAEHADRFAEKVFAEMRGVSDESGRSPFWEALGRHFFTMDFPRADYLSGVLSKAFIAELMPKYPLYVPLLSEEAQRVIGQPHEMTRAAMRMLEEEGFRHEGYVDIFDAGPTLESRLKDIRAVRESRRASATIADAPSGGELHLVSNARLAGFRSCLARTALGHPETVQLSAATARCLDLAEGDPLRVVPLRPPAGNT